MCICIHGYVGSGPNHMAPHVCTCGTVATHDEVLDKPITLFMVVCVIPTKFY